MEYKIGDLVTTRSLGSLVNEYGLHGNIIDTHPFMEIREAGYTGHITFKIGEIVNLDGDNVYQIPSEALLPRRCP